MDQIYIFLKCKMLRIVGTLQCLTASIVGLNGLYMTFDVYKGLSIGQVALQRVVESVVNKHTINML